MSFVLGPLEAGLSALWQSKPSVPAFHWVDLAQQQLDTAQGNLESLGTNEQIGSNVNQFMRGERAKTLAGIPGGADIEDKTAADLKAWLSGQLSPDVQSAVERGANARAYAGGYGGSGMGRNLTSRDLGLTSQQLQQAAVPLASQYENAAYQRRAVPEFNPATMFIDPLSAARFNEQQYGQQWNRDWLANRIAAQPEPWQQSIMSSVNSLGSMADQAGAAYLGMLGGGMGVGGGGRAPAAPPPPAGGVSDYGHGYYGGISY